MSAIPGYSLMAGKVKTLQFTPLAFVAANVAFAAHTLKFNLPERGQIIGIRVAVGLKGGTFSTATLDIKVGSTSILVAPFDIAAAVAGTPIDKEIAALTAGSQNIARNAEMSIVLAESGGSSPVWSDVVIQIHYQALGE
jgi:hypothetical protein